jgi:hypothetical protein
MVLVQFLQREEKKTGKDALPDLGGNQTWALMSMLSAKHCQITLTI